MSSDTADWLVCHLGEQRCAIAASSVRQVMRPPHIAGVPGASPHCLGLVGWQGRVFTVVNAAARLESRSARDSAQERLVLWVQGEHAGGLLVDGVVGLRRLPTSAVLPLECVLAPPWDVVAGLLRDGNDAIPILEPSLWFATITGGAPAGMDASARRVLP